ncbi:DUF1295 domain-containing protein [Aquabacter cavernae]|uniref:DUF1295 domain-containing protein n=1 Tax=Aquabacter cavernae TaxID=2496029 RepID=UPI000F8F7D28|nr:DUF1295 domain-containing protein [Aquabacter cavernae]
MPVYVLVVLIVLGLCLVMAGAWALAARTGNSGWVDTLWSAGTGLAAMVAALVPVHGMDGYLPRQLLLAVLAGLWSARLAGHILARTLAGHDDPRYAHLKREWGADAPRRMFLFLQAQAVAGALLALCVLAARNPAPGWRIWDLLGLAMLVVAVAGEGLADRQLARFRADKANAGRVCDVGLWGLSRHPNYFFEWLGWWAYPLIAAPWAGGPAWGWLALLGPVMMYWVLVHASGIPPTEAHMLRSRGEAYRAYQARVNAFWPFRRSGAP